jgi:hypothetical protein
LFQLFVCPSPDSAIFETYISEQFEHQHPDINPSDVEMPLQDILSLYPALPA